ncbi:MAG: hypothetical protein ACJ71K_10825 [Nitrososphaeraceae archaeon]
MTASLIAQQEFAEIDEMDRQRSQAIESLEISDGRVKCQKCSVAVPLLRSWTKPNSIRIDVLQNQIRCVETYSRRSINNNAKAKADANIKALKSELAS